MTPRKMIRRRCVEKRDQKIWRRNTIPLARKKLT